MKMKKVLSVVLVLAMALTFVPAIPMTVAAAEPTALQSDTKENTNQAGGIIYTKTSTAKSDGTIDITLTAHTTGTVKQMSTVTPTDIVLVLDFSRSMEENVTVQLEDKYEAVTGSRYTYTTGSFFNQTAHTGYGFNNTDSYYINTGTSSNPVYTRVAHTGRDNNGFDMYEYSVGTDEVIIYPIMSSGSYPDRQHDSYPVVQFYDNTGGTATLTKTNLLKSAVKSFIDTTALMNEGLEDDAKHTISIVKFSNPTYLNGSDVPSIVEGTSQNTTANSSYVVKNFTTVDNTTKEALKDAVDGISVGTYTAVAHGLNLAEALFKNRDQIASDSIDRNQVVIVFTDGAPAHSGVGAYEESVANSSIAKAQELKSAGIEIYGVSIAEGANSNDLSSNINKFMHYMSSNFPNATNMSTAGSGGSIDNGFYLTTDESHSLSMLFDEIIHDIDHPTVTMGPEATMVDTLSPYFDFENGSATDVILQTSSRNADGTWADPVDDPNITYEIIEDRLIVNGFDFDENYVSENGRGDNNDFYGKRLVVTFTVIPDYDAIDIAKVTLMDGILPTNTGFASLNDSDENPTAEVETPELETHQVIYRISGVPGMEDVTYNRFTGSPVDVDEEPVVEGYTFSGWTMGGIPVDGGDEFTMPNNDVEIVGVFTANEYPVRYVIDGIDLGVSAPAEQNYDYATTVAVEGEPSVPGYAFTGWYTDDITVENGEFTMPNHEVIFYGSFEPGDITYNVEYYFENIDGDTDPTNMSDYTINDAEGYEGYAKFETVARAELKTYTGYTLNRDLSTISGDVTVDGNGEGNLVLKLYYQLNRYDVIYSYVGDFYPDGTTPTDIDLDAEALTDVKYGSEITVIGAPVIPDASSYEFAGWNADNVAGISAGGTFTMPAADVHIVGSFYAASDAEYKIEHWLEDDNGNFVHNTESDVTAYGTPDTMAYIRIANAFTFEGYTVDPEESEAQYPQQIYNQSENRLEQEIADGGGTVFRLYYTKDRYEVRYEFVNEPVSTMPALPATEYYTHLEEVTISGDDMSIPGYTFSGWDTEDATVLNGGFTMPAKNVVLRGRYSPAVVEWKEEHYLQDADNPDLYVLDDTANGNITHHNLTGTQVVVHAGHYHGFAFNESKTNLENAANGLPSLNNGSVTTEVLADGSLVVKFYYDRNKIYNIEYIYEGTVPAGAESQLPAKAENVPFGKEISVEEAPYIPGYTFSDWSTADVTVINGEFTMPDNNVTFKGSFTADTVDYAVNYWFQNVDSDDYTLDTANSYIRQATVGQHVEADAISHTGFSVNSAMSNPYGHVSVDSNGDGNLVLNVYFDRHTYSVTYQYVGEAPAGAPDLSSMARANVRYGAEITVEGTPSLSGYAFDGWYTHTAVVDNGKFTMPDHDVTFLGLFVTQYTVSYDLNGGTGADGVDYNAVYVDAGENVTVKEAPTRSGYKFTGWKEDTTDYAPGDVVTVNENLVFVAQWKRTGGGGGGGNTTKYTLSYESNGGTEFADEEYSSGTIVKLNKKPSKDGYIFDGWHTDENLSEDVTEVAMTKDITVYAAWIEDNGAAGNGHDTPDSLNGDDHFAYVVGYPNGNVKPHNTITRAEVTTIFFRLLKDEVRDSNLAYTNAFNDSDNDDWFNTAVSTMSELGIVNGRKADKFAPNSNITRAEFAVICARFDNSEYVITDSFTDISGHWAEEEIHEAAAHGWIRGYENGTFKPDAYITRAEAMTMINRVLNRVPENDSDLLPDMIVWPDNSDKTAWYYLPVQEATNSHNFVMKNNIYESWTSLKEGRDWTQYE